MLLQIVALSVSYGGDLTISDGKVSRFEIVLPDKLPTPELDASLVETARLLQTAIEANGVKIAVVRESDHETSKVPGIFLGNTTFAKEQGIDVSRLEGWSYIHRVIGKRDLILTGHDHPAPAESDNPRRPTWDRVGTAKGVADFLRIYAGVRFLYPEMSPYRALPRANEIDLLVSPAIEFLPTPSIEIPDDLNVTHTPAIRFNTAHPQGGSFYDLANNRFPRVDEIFGGHTWARAVPPETYRKTNPEYFSLVGGKRLLEGNGQYCLSNPEVQELIYQDLAGQLNKGLASVDLGQPDGFRPCQCEDCKTLYETGDDWGEKIWIFNRKVAERLLKSHPDQKVTMMSYILTAKPPESFKKFPLNTRIMLTGTNEEDIEPWRGYEVPGGFTGYLYNWCPNLATRYTPMRTPSFVEEQAKRLKENRIQGFYRDGPGALYGLEGPVYYTMGRMYDDPENLFARDLVPEFVDAAFGESAWHMTRFYDRLYHTIALYSDHIGTRCDVWTYQPAEGRRRKTVQDPFRMVAFLYPPKVLIELEEFLSGAEQKSRTPKVKERLALVRREFNYVKHFARVAHLHQAYEVQPDFTSRDRLCDAIDSRNTVIATYFGERGRAVPVSEGWSHVMFPPGGHNEAHLKLAYNNYQEPYENTCFNWDTEKIRVAPLPGAKSLRVKKAEGKTQLSLSSPEWKNAEAHSLINDNKGAGADAKTEFRVLSDKERIYVKVEAFGPMDEAESIALYLEPAPGKEAAYRFQVGPDIITKSEAASGLVEDVMDPRFILFDPDWKGEWDVETKVDSKGEAWQALSSIPFTAVRSEAPESGVFWRCNVARTPGKKREYSTWSTAPGVRSPDDRAGFGEWVFGEGK